MKSHFSCQLTLKYVIELLSKRFNLKQKCRYSRKNFKTFFIDAIILQIKINDANKDLVILGVSDIDWISGAIE